MRTRNLIKLKYQMWFKLWKLNLITTHILPSALPSTLFSIFIRNLSLLFRQWRSDFRKRWHFLKYTNKMYEGRTESHEQLFFASELGTADEGQYGGRWNQLLCYSWVFVTSIACITWPVSLLTKWPTTICRFASVLSSNFIYIYIRIYLPQSTYMFRCATHHLQGGILVYEW